MIDFNTAVKNEFLRFLYAIIIPGFIVSIFISYSITTNLFDPYYIFNDVSKSSIFVASSIFFMLLCGFIIEIIGVYVESKYLDDELNSIDNHFNQTWDSYLNLDSNITSTIILVQYYRTILTKFKFLLNFPISLIMTVIVILFNSFFLRNSIINFCDKTQISLFVIIILFTSLICYMSFRRARYCAKLLHKYRCEILKIYPTIASK